MAERRVQFERTGRLATVPSALLLSGDSLATLARLTERLHGLVERALDWLLADPRRLARYFADHARMFPYLVKTAGLPTWQGYARYDVAVWPGGELTVIELNTACPAGFFHGGEVTAATRASLAELGLTEADAFPSECSMDGERLVDFLLELETAAGVAPGLVGLVNDENELHNEMDPLIAAFARRGRDARETPAAEIACDAARDRPTHGGEPLSLSLNKIRISTPDSPAWKWAAGFQQRYAGFLAAVTQGRMASANNLAACAVAEDKGLLAVLICQDFLDTLAAEDQQFLRDHIAPTYRLTNDGQPAEIARRGAEILDARNDWVVKPANEGRGFRVTVGAAVDDRAWREACRVDPALPLVAQRRADLAQFPVADATGQPAQGPHVRPMRLTLGLAVIGGRFAGVLSRVSASAVTNVGAGGALQAALGEGESPIRRKPCDAPNL